MGDSNTVVSANTMYRRLQQYCPHQSINISTMAVKKLMCESQLVNVNGHSVSQFSRSLDEKDPIPYLI